MPPVKRDTAFSSFSRSIFTAFVDATIPHAPGLEADQTEAVVEWVDAMMTHFPSLLRRLFPLGLWVLEFLPLFFLGIPRRFSRLPRETRRRYIRGWLQSRWSVRRDFIKGYTGIVLMGYYDQKAVLDHLKIDHQGYLDQKRAEREKLIGEPIG